MRACMLAALAAMVAVLAACNGTSINSPKVRLCRDTATVAVRTPPGFSGTITVKVTEDRSRCRTVK